MGGSRRIERKNSEIILVFVSASSPIAVAVGLYFLGNYCLFVTGMHSHNSSSRFDVFSLNVWGIRDQAKRRGIFSFLKDQKANIFFLQETYSEPNDEKCLEKGMGRRAFFLTWHKV